jgi:phosphoserine aminotransferase
MASLLYNAIDSSDFYRGHADADARSIMNVTFRLPSEELEKKFAAEATAQGLDGLKDIAQSEEFAPQSTTRFHDKE